MPCLICESIIHILTDDYVRYEYGLAHRECVSSLLEEVEV